MVPQNELGIEVSSIQQMCFVEAMAKSNVQSAFISALDILTFRLGGTSGRAKPSGAAHAARGAVPAAYRITAVCEPDLVEIEDEHAARQRIVLSYGAREMLDLEMKRRRTTTPVGLRLRREVFDVEGIAFSRWAVAE